MQSNELETIVASIQDAPHCAYALHLKPETMAADAAHNDNAEPAGTPEREQHQTSSPPGSIKDFLYPLGAKK